MLKFNGADIYVRPVWWGDVSHAAWGAVGWALGGIDIESAKREVLQAMAETADIGELA